MSPPVAMQKPSAPNRDLAMRAAKCLCAWRTKDASERHPYRRAAMNTLAVIQIPDFALQAVLRHEPELREKPVALVEDTLSRGESMPTSLATTMAKMPSAPPRHTLFNSRAPPSIPACNQG
jgi:hypothetical protein